jgi:hypothetical protein
VGGGIRAAPPACVQGGAREAPAVRVRVRGEAHGQPPAAHGQARSLSPASCGATRGHLPVCAWPSPGGVRGSRESVNLKTAPGSDVVGTRRAWRQQQRRDWAIRRRAHIRLSRSGGSAASSWAARANPVAQACITACALLLPTRT